MTDFITRVRCAYHGHYWTTHYIEIRDNDTFVTQICARYCGAVKEISYPNPSP